MSVCVPLLLGSLIVLSSAVDRNNFKTCDQSGFCKRHRSMDPGSSPYTVQLSKAEVENSKLSVPLLNTLNNVALRMEISALKNNMARIRIKEIEPIRERYEPPVGDVLVEEPALDTFQKLHLDNTKAVFAIGNNKLSIQAHPFLVEISTDDVPIMSLNSQALFKFEHYRTKNEGAQEEKVEEEKPEGEGEEEQKEEEQPEEEPDMWEETFKTHKDTKPFGPSSIGFDVSFPGFEFVYGIPEHAESMALKSTANTEPYRLYNLDVFEYELNNPMALYGSIPVMLAHNEERTVGMFWLNTAEMWVDIKSNKADKSTFSKLVDFVKGDQDIPQVDTHWIAESGLFDVFLMFGPTSKDVFKSYSSLTGATPLPPLFSLAYHQCRWNYNDEKDVAQVNENFDVHDIPMDVIWLDIEHTDGKKYFTWDSVKFPNPAEMISNVSAVGRKMVTIIDPHIKRDSNYHVHQEAQSKSLYIQDRDGNEYDGWCWPGASSYLDFIDPKVQDFWAEKYQPSEYKGSTLDLFTWNDMNEPSVFNGPEITMHKDAKHYGGWEHRDIHNIYGFYQHKSTVKGQLMRDPEQRPFVLTRAFFSGTQRYGAVWTGDNTAQWDHLKISIPMLLTLNLVGITFSGADVGGFFGNPDAELQTRWYQAAAYQPFFRGHSHLETRRREPWLLPDVNRDIVRDALRARYRLLPYWYTLFYAASEGSDPPMRPLWIEFPKDKSTFGMDDQFMVGDKLLVHPVTDAGASGVNIYLPGSDEVWYDMDSNQQYPGGQAIYIPVKLSKIPVFRRGGYMIPQRDRVRRSSALTYQDPFTLVFALNKKNFATGDLYMDDYNSFKYQSGNFIHRQLTFANNVIDSKDLNPGSKFTTPAWIEKIILIGINAPPKSIQLTVAGTVQTALDFKYDEVTATLTIRKPSVAINKDFKINLS